MSEVLGNSSNYEETCSETDYSEATSSLSSTYTDICDDRYNKVDAWVEHFDEVYDQINKIGDEIDECTRSLSQTQNDIKEAYFKLQLLESHRQYKELMLSYNRKRFWILTKRLNNLLKSSRDLISRFPVVRQEDGEIQKQLEDLVEKRSKVDEKIERVIQQLHEDMESFGPIAKVTEEVKLRLKQLFLYESYLAETLELNRAVMDVLRKRLEHLLLTVDQDV